MSYIAPHITDLGSVRNLTLAGGSLDKDGKAFDAASQVIPGLDGSIVPDPR